MAPARHIQRGRGQVAGFLADGLAPLRLWSATLALLGLAFLALAPAAEAKFIEATWGADTFGTDGGLFNSPGDVAVRESTGQVYVADESNNRVQRFSAGGAFELAFGRDVVKAGAPNDLGTTAFERCRVAGGNVATDCKQGIAVSNDHPGGELHRPTALAVDQATGELFVLERDNQRISVFDADGNWLRSFGWDVVKPGAPGNVAGNEQQRLTVNPAVTGGTFEVRFRHNNVSDSSAPLPHDASAAQLQAALEGLSTIGAGDVTVSGAGGGPWTVDFQGALANVDVGPISFVTSGTGNFESLVPIMKDGVVTETILDGGRYEVCTVAADCKIGTAGGGAGQLDSRSLSMALGPDGSDLFVASNRRVNQYSPTGAFVRAFGWGVDSGADAFEVCTAASLCQAGVMPPEVPGHDPFPSLGQLTGNVHLGVDDGGVIYSLLTYEDHTDQPPENLKPILNRFDSTKTAAADILLSGAASDEGPIGRCTYCMQTPLPRTGASAGLEFDPDSGHLFYADLTQIVELQPSGADLSLVESPVPSANTDQLNGLGIDPATEKIYASTFDADIGNRILVFGENPPPPVVVEIEPVTEIEDTGSATLNGEITPNGPSGLKTKYRFEYAKDGGEWVEVPVPDQSIGDGSSPVSVSQPISGLEANSLYRVRLVATKPFGLGTVTSPEVTFNSAAIPPGAVTVFPQSRTDTTATLTALVNPNNSPTDYWFEWGETSAYGNRVPIPDGSIVGGKPQKVSEHLTGLAPETTYHYRVVADNGVEIAPGDTEVEGADVEFTTRPTGAEPELHDCPSGPDAARCFEMVTPPFKVVRSPVEEAAPDGHNPNPGIPSLAGNTVLWTVPYFPLSEEVDFPDEGDKRILRRTAAGWTNETLNTLAPAPGTDRGFISQEMIGLSGDLETAAWRVTYANNQGEHAGALLPTEGPLANWLYTRRTGTGVEGFHPWLTNPSEQVTGLGIEQATYGNENDIDNAILDDEGTAMARWGFYGGLAEDPNTPADEDPSDNQPLWNGSNGPDRTMAYLQRAADPDLLPTAPKQLVNECTGSGGSATQIPERDSNGTALNAADDFIDSQSCAKGTLTHLRGATIGGGNRSKGGASAGTAFTALSEGGDRVFFQSPAPQNSSPPSICATGTAKSTNCPPQLFVRQYDSEGSPRVRWISRSRSVAGPDNTFSGASIAKQAIDLIGVAGFEAASRDGSVVYFKTNAPLTPDDPNGTGAPVPGGVKAGKASDDSWDLYRYELPEDLDADPSGGTLTRVSGGPTGAADPNTNPSTGVEPASEGLKGGAARFVSDDGSRAYFVTGAPIAAADATPPSGGATAPGGAAVGNSATRNLYLFDADETGAERWRFVARIPFDMSALSGGTGPDSLNSCASFGVAAGEQLQQGRQLAFAGTTCFRGTADGRQVLFTTTAQLTGDDADTASDLYLYDAEADELTRISAPAPGANAVAYVCDRVDVNEAGTCNGDLGFSPRGFHGGVPKGKGWGGIRYNNIAKDAEGVVSVFFESRSELVPEDTNGTHWDVYEWREGELSLISRAKEGHHSYFSGNSKDGRDVFVWTTDRIDPRELEEAGFDVYDARSGGGFPYTPPLVPCDVLAFKCEGQATPPPPSGSPASAGFQGSGNVAGKPKPRCRKGKVRRKGRCVSRKANRQRKQRAGANRRGGRR